MVVASTIRILLGEIMGTGLLEIVAQDQSAFRRRNKR
jgi:hypothetical protein